MLQFVYQGDSGILHMARINMNKKFRNCFYRNAFLLLSSAVMCLILSGTGYGAIYGFKDSHGAFQPKVTVSLGKKEIIISKIDPEEKFKSFALILNKKNQNLQKNVNQISVEWLNAENRGGKPTTFAGPTYDAAKLRFEEPMTRSVTLKLTDKSGKNLFAVKSFSDLFTIQVDQHTLSPSESGAEADSPIKFGSGRDVSLNLDKTSLQFDESNIKKGEIINLDNRSGLDQVVGIELPEKLLLYYQIVRKPEQTKVPRENWDRFNISSDSGIFVVLIPESDPGQLQALNGKEILIKVYQGDKTRETIRVPIRTTPDGAPSESLPSGIQTRDITTGKQGTLPEKTSTKEVDRPPTSTEAKTVATSPPQSASSFWNSTLAWILLILNLLISMAVLGYGAFMLLPRMQVLEDRLSKTEMFIHGSREAIREELDQMKDEVFRHSDRTSGTD